MKINTEIQIHAPASSAWTVIGERFGEIAEWTSSLNSSSLSGELAVGTERYCDNPGWGPFPEGQTVERLTEFSPHERALTYEPTDGLPWFVTSAKNRWTVTPLGDEKCLVRSDATVELMFFLRPLGFIFTALLAGPMKTLLGELTTAIESV